MGPRQKNWCQTIVLKAIEAVVPGFEHSCTRGTCHKAVIVHGSTIDEYCTAVNGTSTKTTLLPTGQYKICRNLKYHNIDTAAATIPGNAASTIPDPGTRPDRPDLPGVGGVGVVMLPRAAFPKQEAVAEIYI